LYIGKCLEPEPPQKDTQLTFDFMKILSTHFSSICGIYIWHKMVPPYTCMGVSIERYGGEIGEVRGAKRGSKFEVEKMVTK
jgi:hypothetical protein